jgi:putative transposon-encoded protein
VLGVREVNLDKTKFTVTDEITIMFEKTVTKFGGGAKIDCPKEFLGKKVYVLVRKENKGEMEEKGDNC